MSAIHCQDCNAKQPHDHKSGDLCVECGSAVRLEARCGWCAETTPENKFCRHCGFEMVPSDLYEAARMLKGANVDKLTLRERLLELPEDQKQHFQSLYQQQFAVIKNLSEQIRVCQAGLELNDHADKFEDDMVKLLPLEKDALEALKEGPKGPYFYDFDTLMDIYQNSPIEKIRLLAVITLFKMTNRAGLDAYGMQWHIDFLEMTCHEFKDEDSLWIEAFSVLGHWKSRLPQFAENNAKEGLYHNIYEHGLHLLPQTKNTNLGYYIANTVRRLADPDFSEAFQQLVHEQTFNGLSSNDADISLSSAIALNHEEALAHHVVADKDEWRNWRSDVALDILARRRSGCLARVLEHGTPDQIETILELLQSHRGHDLPENLRTILIGRIKKGSLKPELPIIAQAETTTDLELSQVIDYLSDTKQPLAIVDVLSWCRHLDLVPALQTLSQFEFELEGYWLDVISSVAQENCMPEDLLTRLFAALDAHHDTVTSKQMLLCTIAQYTLKQDNSGTSLMLVKALLSRASAISDLANDWTALLKAVLGRDIDYYHAELGKRISFDFKGMALSFDEKVEWFFALSEFELSGKAEDYEFWHLALKLFSQNFEAMVEEKFVEIGLLESFGKSLFMVANATENPHHQGYLSNLLKQNIDHQAPLLNDLNALEMTDLLFEITQNATMDCYLNPNLIANAIEFGFKENRLNEVEGIVRWQFRHQGEQALLALKALNKTLLSESSAEQAAIFFEQMSSDLNDLNYSKDGETYSLNLLNYINHGFDNILSLTELTQIMRLVPLQNWLIPLIEQEINTLVTDEDSAKTMLQALVEVIFDDNGNTLYETVDAAKKIIDQVSDRSDAIDYLLTHESSVMARNFIESMLEALIDEDMDGDDAADMLEKFEEAENLFILKDVFSKFKIEPTVEQIEEEEAEEEEEDEDDEEEELELMDDLMINFEADTETLNKVYMALDEHYQSDEGMTVIGLMLGRMGEIKEILDANEEHMNSLLYHMTRIMTIPGLKATHPAFANACTAIQVFTQAAVGSTFRLPFMLQIKMFREQPDTDDILAMQLDMMLTQLSDDEWLAMSNF